MSENNKYQIMLDCFGSASTEIKLLPVDKVALGKLNEYLTYNSQSFFGTVLTNTGGIIVDDWLRIYGSGEIDFTSRNQELSDYGVMIVAEDVTGGLFAMQTDGVLSYFAPDNLEWEEMTISYSDFLQWITEKERMNQFYETVRFNNWQQVVKNISTNHGIGYFPFLWTEADDEKRHTGIVPILEIQKLQFEFYKAL